MDDFIKIFRHNKDGLKGKYKIVGQFTIGLIVGLVLWTSPDVKSNINLEMHNDNGKEIVVKHGKEAQKTLKTTIPFIKIIILIILKLCPSVVNIKRQQGGFCLLL